MSLEALIVDGTNQLPKPPIIAGMTTKKCYNKSMRGCVSIINAIEIRKLYLRRKPQSVITILVSLGQSRINGLAVHRLINEIAEMPPLLLKNLHEKSVLWLTIPKWRPLGSKTFEEVPFFWLSIPECRPRICRRRV